MRYALVTGLILSAFLFSVSMPSFAEDYGISGTWYHGDTPTHIRVEHNNRIILNNGEGSRATGYFEGPWHIRVPDWNVNGQITHGGNRIAWSNNTTWTRFPDKKTHISGRWYHDGKPTSIRVYDNGWRFMITNEDGKRSDGKAVSPRVLYIPSLHINGYVNRDATKIRWTNGTVWTRSSGGSDGPLSSPQ